MDDTTPAHNRSLSHEEYVSSLLRPSLSESRRISEIQLRKEQEIDSKYRRPEEHDAATKIQRTYRGHRERRQLEGLTLDPSSRWMEIIRELRFRSAIALPQDQLSRPKLSSDGRPRNSSDAAKANWRRIGYVAEHASAGERRDSPELSVSGSPGQQRDDEPSMLMDIRYFLEMVDQKHRYGSNLQVFHEEWLRSKSNSNFFHWLDHGEGRNMDLPGCSREKLDRERIRYLSKDERRDYLVEVDEAGKLRWAKTGELITTNIREFKDSMGGIVSRSDDSAVSFAEQEVQQQASSDRHLLDGITRTETPEQLNTMGSDGADDSSSEDPFISPGAPAQQPNHQAKKPRKRIIASPATILNKLLRASVRPGTFIYVADTIGRLYVGIKDSGAFQHASFLSGARISSAGLIGIENGQLTYLSPLSGHYRPTTKSLRRFIAALKAQGVDLGQLRVSHAYEVLLGIEVYGKAKKGFRKLQSPRKDRDTASPGPDRKLHDAINSMSATDLVEGNWKRRERRSTLEKVMGELHMKHRREEKK